MPDKSQATQQIKDLVSGLSDGEFQELCVQALRSWSKTPPGRTHLDLRDVGYEVLKSLSLSKKVTLLDPAHQKEALHAHATEPWLSGFSEFVVWLVRAGLAFPIGSQANGLPYSLLLTRAGLRFVDAPDDHPLRSGFIDRLVVRSPGLPEEVTSLLTDARRCLNAGLMRPAIVLMGVAYEVAVEHVAGSLAKKGHLAAADLDDKAAKLLGKVRNQVRNALADREHQFAADAACDFAVDPHASYFGYGRSGDGRAHDKPRSDSRRRTPHRMACNWIGSRPGQRPRKRRRRCGGGRPARVRNDGEPSQRKPSVTVLELYGCGLAGLQNPAPMGWVMVRSPDLPIGRERA